MENPVDKCAVLPPAATRHEILFPGWRVGHVHDFVAKTGVTVILFDQSSPASGAICGRATGTRQVDSLRPDHIGAGVDAFVFTGGSAFGLDAVGGVLRHLEEQGRGLPTKYGVIPICPSATLFDLGFGDARVRPDLAMGRAACLAATGESFTLGSVGAGCGATVGKLNGAFCAMKGGFGAHTEREGDLFVAALSACNAFGDVIDPETGGIIAGARTESDSMDFLDTAAAFAQGKVPKAFFPPDSQNTVLNAVITNAELTKSQCFEAAQAAVAGIKAAVRPALSPVDGDVVFLASVGKVKASVADVGRLAAICVAKAIISAVMNADGFGMLPTAVEIAGK